MRNLRVQHVAVLGLCLIFVFIASYSLRIHLYSSFGERPDIVATPHEPPLDADVEITPPPPPVPNPDEVEKDAKPTHSKYKVRPTATPIPVVDNFPLAAGAHSASELPPIPPWNSPPNPHVPENTPLFIGFTRNWRLLQQTVVSYITAGWPPEDIYVFENTGTMKSNELGLLSLQNPFFLNHTRLHMLGVNVVITPTLLSFAQLQNFFIWTAIQKNFTTYFYGHMDVIVLPYEYRYKLPLNSSETAKRYPGFKSLYEQAVDALRLATDDSLPDPNSSNTTKPWAARFFAYDRLALVNRLAYESIGGWDTNIPYYFSDCDLHDRLKMWGFEYNGPDIEIGDFCDVAGSLDDLLVLYRKKDTGEARFTVDKPEIPPPPPPSEPEKEEEIKEKEELPVDKRDVSSSHRWVSDELGSPAFMQLFEVAGSMIKLKNIEDPRGRNTWQAKQTGGEGEPYYRDPIGFETGLQMIMQTGRDVYAEKWGHRECGLVEHGLKAGDEWKVEHDWE